MAKQCLGRIRHCEGKGRIDGGASKSDAVFSVFPRQVIGFSLAFTILISLEQSIER